MIYFEIGFSKHGAFMVFLIAFGSVFSTLWVLSGSSHERLIPWL